MITEPAAEEIVRLSERVVFIIGAYNVLFFAILSDVGIFV